jgi:hypothetical protein
MPQATDELRAIMEKRFGDRIDESGPLQHLLAQGFSERGGMLRPPPDHRVSDEEWECIEFLCDEWDFAYLPLG